MNLIRSMLFSLFFYPGSALFVALAFPAALLGREAVIRVTYGWARYHHWCARLLLGIKVRVEGTAPRGATLVAAKHQSMFETIELLRYLDRPAVVLKRELADLPGWGWVAQTYGCIPVDRDGGAAALRRMMKAAKTAIAEGRPILIFPEGTRVAVGEQPPLQSGFAGLYRALGLTVVPLAVDSGRLWPRRSFVKRPGVVTFRFGESLAPGRPRGEVEAAVHKAINALEA